jgi:hypothetical protein
MTLRRSLYVFTLVLLGNAWLPLASAQATTSGGTSTPPLIAIGNPGDFAAKVGSLTAPWVDPLYGNTTNNMGAVASDATNGPLIAVVDTSDNVWAKEGSLTAAWTEVWTGTADSVAVASDATNGPLIAVVDTSDNVWAKEGSLTAAWTEVIN